MKTRSHGACRRLRPRRVRFRFGGFSGERLFGLLRWTETEKSGRLPERSAARIVPGSGKPALGAGGDIPDS